VTVLLQTVCLLHLVMPQLAKCCVHSDLLPLEVESIVPVSWHLAMTFCCQSLKCLYLPKTVTSHFAIFQVAVSKTRLQNAGHGTAPDAVDVTDRFTYLGSDISSCGRSALEMFRLIEL